MPELPEVEILVRHLRPRLAGRRIVSVTVPRPRAVAPSSVAAFSRGILGAEITAVGRRAKYLVFDLRRVGKGGAVRMLGHLGMTGRMYLQSHGEVLARHVGVVLGLGKDQWIFEDARQFGGMTLDTGRLDGLGPEPLEESFTPEMLARALGASKQGIKVRLMDQRVLAGLGNIYASEALFRAGISPVRESRTLEPGEIFRLHAGVREVLSAAIRLGTSLPLDFDGKTGRSGLFYYGAVAEAEDGNPERFAVYDREGQPCRLCGAVIERCIQAARSSYFCRRCQS